jgi:hypothetical protein
LGSTRSSSNVFTTPLLGNHKGEGPGWSASHFPLRGGGHRLGCQSNGVASTRHFSSSRASCSPASSSSAAGDRQCPKILSTFHCQQIQPMPTLHPYFFFKKKLLRFLVPLLLLAGHKGLYLPPLEPGIGGHLAVLPDLRKLLLANLNLALHVGEFDGQRADLLLSSTRRGHPLMPTSFTLRNAIGWAFEAIIELRGKMAPGFTNGCGLAF